MFLTAGYDHVVAGVGSAAAAGLIAGVSGPKRTSGWVTPITLATNKPGSPIKLGFEPWALAITPNGRTAYVVNGNADTVIPVMLASGKLGRPIKVGRRAVAIAITPNGRTAYVVNNVGNTVTPITLATGMPGHPIKVGRSPNLIVINPNGKTAYVIDSRGAGDNVSPINLVTNKPEPRLSVSKANAIAIAPNGDTAWVHSGISVKLVPIRIG